jgi:hypothetical protein
VVVPETIVLEVREAGGTAVGTVHHMVRLATGRGLVAAAESVAAIVVLGISTGFAYVLNYLDHHHAGTEPLPEHAALA